MRASAENKDSVHRSCLNESLPVLGRRRYFVRKVVRCKGCNVCQFRSLLKDTHHIPNWTKGAGRAKINVAVSC